MKNQVDDMNAWARVYYDRNKELQKKFFLQHYNLDFSKWSPKDNILKYFWVVAATYTLSKGEKLYMIAALCKHFEKVIFLDYELLQSAKKLVIN